MPMPLPLITACSLARHRRAGLLLFTVLALTAIATPAAARDYRIEAIVFEHLGGSPPGASGYWYPSPRRAISLDTDAATAAGFVSYDSELDLAEEAAAMASSSRYRVLRHYAWQQPGLDDDNAIRVRVSIGSRVPLYIPDEPNNRDTFQAASANPQPGRSEPVTSFTVNGTLRVRLGRFLHLESRLVYTDLDEGRSYRLYESRKMRSRELHYVDNPRFGILTRIVPVEETEPASAPETSEPVEQDVIDSIVDDVDEALPG